MQDPEARTKIVVLTRALRASEARAAALESHIATAFDSIADRLDFVMATVRLPCTEGNPLSVEGTKQTIRTLQELFDASQPARDAAKAAARQAAEQAEAEAIGAANAPIEFPRAAGNGNPDRPH